MTNLNLQQLSFLGDAVFELMVREHLIGKNIVKLNDLQNFTLMYVPAKRQAYFVDILVKNEFLTFDEMEIIRKGRNIKTHKSPKNCSVITYKYATAFEILIGFLYLNDKNRLNEVFNYIVNL